MRLLVSGSRQGHPRVWGALDVFLKDIGRPELVIVGGARGVDAGAARWARARDLTLREFPVSDDDWRELGPGAGHLRNAAMVALCGPEDYLVAFPRGRSPGTRGCIELAAKQGLTCFVIDDAKSYMIVSGERFEP